ncbi:MAG: ABC transporter permease [Bryobacteraceae bacterium]
MPAFWRDARFAWRIFVRNPAFSLIAILSLCLGIGANTAIFSVFEKLQLEQLPYRDPARLVIISEVAPKEKDGFGVCVGGFLAFRDQNGVFESMGADQFYWPANLTGGDGAQPLIGQRITQGVLPTLGIQPALGRWFLQDDYNDAAPPAVIISHRLWQRATKGVASSGAAARTAALGPRSQGRRPARRRRDAGRKQRDWFGRGGRQRRRAATGEASASGETPSHTRTTRLPASARCTPPKASSRPAPPRGRPLSGRGRRAAAHRVAGGNGATNDLGFQACATGR